MNKMLVSVFRSRACRSDDMFQSWRFEAEDWKITRRRKRRRKRRRERMRR